MLSNWQVWDFFQNHSSVIQQGQFGLYACYAFDPYINKLLKDSIDAHSIEGGITTLMADDITTQWIEDNFMSLGLFGNSDSFIIQNAQKLSKDCQKLLAQKASELILDGRYFILFFNEDSEFFKSFAKSDQVKAFKLETPKFWDMNKLLDFLATKLKVRLSYQAKQIILDKVENSCKDFVNILKALQINFGVSEVTPQMLEQLLVASRLDKFQLASLYSIKKKKQFFKTVLEIDATADMLRDLFYFMQGHFLKIYDPSYMDKKKNISKYDKKILSYAQSWSKEELLRDIDIFRELEQDSKLKRPNAANNLKRQYLMAMTAE
jgi:hypothetical protein